MPSKLDGILTCQIRSRESEPPYLMVSLLRSEKKVVLWKFKIAVLSTGYSSLRLMAGFSFGEDDLNPRDARFLGSEWLYIDFQEPCLRLYNLEKINIQSNSPNDKPANGFSYEICFEGSQLIIRSSHFNEESKELKFTVDFPHDTLAKWLAKILEDDIIMCFESTTNVLVILSIRKSLPKSSCKVILLERDSKTHH